MAGRWKMEAYGGPLGKGIGRIADRKMSREENASCLSRTRLAIRFAIWFRAAFHIPVIGLVDLDVASS